MSRRIGRILAFQALYSWDVGGVNIDDLLTFDWIERDSIEDDDSEEPETEEEAQMEVPSAKGVKYCLQEKQLELFESLSADKKSEVFTFARLLVKGTIENLSQIDDLIKSHLSPKWSIDRVNKVALAVVRMSIYEFLYQKDTHANIVIDEAVEIVKDYGSDETHKFTNAILDKIAKDLA